MTLKILPLLFLLSLPSFARERVFGYCQQGGRTAAVSVSGGAFLGATVHPVMNSYPGCSVTVYLAGTITPATIYSDNASTPLANPFTTSSAGSGYWFFYIDNGRYDVKLSGGNIPTPFTLGDILVADPSQFSVGVTQLNGTSNQVCVNQTTGAVIASICTNPTLPGTTTGTFVGPLTGNATTSSAFDHTPTKCSAGFYTLGVDALGNAQNCTAVSSATGDVSSNTSTSIVNQGVLFADTTGKLIGRETGTGVIVSTAGVHGYTATTTPIQFFRSKPNVTGTVYEFSGLPTFRVSDYNFPAQLTGNITIGANVITMTPCPLGLAGADANHYLRLAGGTGTAETVLINGGSCTSGAASGTVGFTAGNTHSGAVAVVSDSGGLREAILASNGNATLTLDSNTTILVGAGSGVTIDKNNILLIGGGWSSVIKARDGAGIDFLLSSVACNSCLFEEFALDGNRTNAGLKATGATLLQLGSPGVGGASHTTVHRLEIHDATSAGILIHDTSIDIEVSNCYIHDNGGILNAGGTGQGIYAYWPTASGDTPARDVRVINNYFSENHNTVTSATTGGSVAFKGASGVIANNYSINGYNNGGQIVASLGPLGADFDTNGPIQIYGNTIIRTASALTEGTSGIEVDSPQVTITGNTIVGHEHGWGIALEGNSTGPGGLGASNTTISANFIHDAFMSIGLLNTGGFVRGTTITGNRIWTSLPSGGSGVGVGLDSAAAATTITGNNFIDTTTPVQDGSTFGAFTSGNYPESANFIYGGSIASSDGINMRCGMSATITGSTNIRFITLPSDTASTNGAGCTVTLIPAAAATWTLGTGGNISVAVASVTTGRPIILVSDGTLFNPLSAGATLPTISKLQYLRGNATTAAIEGATFPFLIADDYNFPAQFPGGTISIGSNTKTLTPCPLGLGGSDIHHYLYVSGGTGAAEGVLITGGSCTSGATSGTVVFTAANTHSGAYSIGSGSGGIFEAMNTLPTTGGKVQMPSGTVNIAGTLIIGKGTATTQSTNNAISLVGQGSGRSSGIAIPTSAGTTLFWVGAAGGTVVQVLGPIGNVEIRDVMIDGNAGGADIGLDIVHSYLSVYYNVYITGWNAIGVRSQAVDFAFPNMVAGNNSNRFDTVEVVGGTGGAANIACQFGQAVPNVNSVFDFASNYISNTACLGGSGIGANIRFADNNTFLMTSFNGAVAALKFTEIAGTGFPTSNWFTQCPMLNLLTSTAGFVALTPNWFFPLTTGEFSQDLGLVEAMGTAGVDSFGKYFGKFSNSPTLYANVNTSAAIANTAADTAFAKSYTIPATKLNKVGAVGRITAGGRFSTTGTPTINFTFFLDALPVAKYVLTTGSGVTNDAFTLSTSFGINTIGALGVLLIGPGTGTTGGFSGTNATVASSVVGQQSLDTTVDHVLTLKAQWGTANPSNTTVLDSMQFDVVYPSTTQ